MAYKAAFFDLDGTILDTLQSLTKACNLTLQAFNCREITPETVKTMIGSGSKVLTERLYKFADLAGKVEFDQVYALYTQNFNACFEYKVKPFKGVVGMLQALKNHGLYVCCLTNKPHESAEKLVKAQFGDLFDVVRGRKEGETPKPDPSNSLDIMSRLHLTKSEIIFVGDSEVDVKTARNAGFHSLIVTWGFGDLETIKSSRPDFIAKSTQSALDYILGVSENLRESLQGK